MPLSGEWKTMIRLHSGDALTALPVYLPADPAIPVEGIPAAPRIERAFGDEVQLLQRERKADVAGWLWGVAYGAVLAIALGFLALLAWGVHRVSLEREPSARARSRRRPAEHEHVQQQRNRNHGDDHGEAAAQDRLRQPLADQRAEQRADAGRAGQDRGRRRGPASRP